MLSKYRMEKANPEMEKARLTSRLNAVQQRIKEVEEQLDEARRNAAFESKYKDDPYWKIAKKRYIETGDPAAIENFRAKQDALEEAEKNRHVRNAEIQEQKRQQAIYDELDARRDVENAVVDYDVAYDSGDEVAQSKAKNALKYATEHYMQVTGKEYKLPSEYKLEDTVPGQEKGDGRTNPARTDASNWLNDAPLFAESGAKNAKEYGAYLLKYADSADGKANKLRLSTADKKLVDNFLDASKDHWGDMGINDQDVARIKSHWSQEDYNAKIADAIKEVDKWWYGLTPTKRRMYMENPDEIPAKYNTEANLKRWGIKKGK